MKKFEKGCSVLSVLIGRSLLSSPLQALPQLSEDVLRIHADVVQRSSLAQHHPLDNSQSTTRCGEKGHLEGAVAHNY